MPLTSKLERKLRAAEESSDDEEYYEVTDRSSSPSVIEYGDAGDIPSSEDDHELDEEDIPSEEEGDAQEQRKMSRVSFATLAKAQDALFKNEEQSRKRKRGEQSSKSQEDKLQALRERLQEIKASKSTQGPAPKKARSNPKRAASEEDDDESDMSGDDASDSDGAPRARSSKHAPAVQSSKRPVSRKRKVVDAKKRVSRDPRFDSISGRAPDENTLNKRYAFLNDYKASEMAELREAIKKTKDEAAKEKLKKKLTSMESQQEARKRKEKQQAVLHEHKKKERELVKEGKTPFYLKKSEQKKLALVDRFQNMKSKDRDRAIERRRKKSAAKERRNMPAERRGA